MENMTTPVGFALSFQRRSRWSRLAAAIGALGFGVSLALAQTAPSVSAPLTVTIPVGSTARFSVSMAGDPLPTLQWQWQKTSGIPGFPAIFAGEPGFSGVNGTVLTISGVTAAMNGYQFRVIASNFAGSVTSAAATLNVTQVPTFTSASSAGFTVGALGTFQVAATGLPALISYSIVSGSLPGGITLDPATGVLSGTPLVSAGSPFYLTIRASNTSGVADQPFTFSASTGSVFTTQPVNATSSLGQTATFTVVTSGEPAPTYRWQRLAVGATAYVNLINDATFSGVTSATLTIMNPSSGLNGDSFRVVATNAVGAVESSAAILTIVNSTTISTLAGTPTVSGSTDGVGAAARFNGPNGIAVDAAGNVYVADTSNHVIRRISTGGAVTTLAGLAGVSGNTDGQASLARFSGPSGIAVTPVGSIYVADTYNHTIRVIATDGTVSTLAGTAGAPGSVNGTGGAARFFSPSGLAIATDGTVFVSDTFNHIIRRVSINGVVTTVAGTAGSQGAVNGAGASARFSYPYGLAIDSWSNLYVADSISHAVRKIDTLGGVTTVAGTIGVAGSVDNSGILASFNQPSGIAIDLAGNIYVADTSNSTIRLISAGGVVTTLAGTAGSPGTADGVISAARFRQPFGIAIDSTGNLYIADTRNHTIRRTGYSAAPSIVTQPQAASAPVGGTASFTVVATGAPAPTYFSWLRQPAGTVGFSVIAADGIFSGVNTATLTISGATGSMNGDQFQAVAGNLIGANATSLAATLTVGTAPVFTSVASTTFQATVAGTFTIAATSSPAATFSATGLPTWATLNPTTGVLSGTAPDTVGSPITATLTATNGIAATQTFTITVLPANVAPTIATQPASTAVGQGQTAAFSVTASGTAPFSYQWSRNGAVITGATGSSLSVPNVQPATAGSYTVTVTNIAGAVTSTAAALVVNTVPVVTLQPRSQTTLAGNVVTFAVTASGGVSFNYQWRKFGVPILGANGATLVLTGVTASDAGNYDVNVSNSLGTATSSLAQLSVATVPVSPIITAQPGSRTGVAGGTVTLDVGATGAPAPTFQWRKNGAAILGATNTALTLTGLQGSDAGSYDVVIFNVAGTVATSAANVRVLVRSFAGTYFGSFAGGLGTFALLVREDNTGVFLGYLPGAAAPVMNLNFSVNDSGAFSFSQSALATATTVSPNEGEPARAAALASLVLSASIAADGSVSGSMSGGSNASLTATRASDAGPTQNVVGFYQAGASNSGAVSYTIAGPNSQAFAVVQSGNASDGGPGTVTTAGSVSVVTSRSVISTTISSAAGTVTGTMAGAITANFAGASEAVLARQRLVNISSRARVGTGDSQAIAGFVISGEESKPVLIRAVGPTLGAAPFNVTGVLASPRLELFRGSTSLLVNTSIAANRVAIDAAGQQAGGFALGSSGADAAILTTLAPGAYTAVVSSTTGTAGVALVEVYDLSAAAPGQKLMNIATRASAGTADATLIAGFVVPAGATKRVLVRGVGPGLSVFGVSGVLAQPTLQLLSGSSTVAQNTNWSTSADRDAITASSAQVGAFGLASGDSALIATLAPGNYTATITGAGGATGVALIEVYELP